jgi:hypothetical protein
MPTAIPCVNCRYHWRRVYEGLDFNAPRGADGHYPSATEEWNECHNEALEQQDEYGPMKFHPPDGFGCVLGEATNGNPTG